MDKEIQRSKVPEVTLVFWIIKILATTLGETGGDAVSMSMNLGYAVSSLIFIGIFAVAVVAQIAAKKFYPFLYWLVVIATTTAGTTMADFADRSLGVGYPGGATLLFVLLMASLAVWYWSAGSISVNTVSTPKIETFYWVAILFSQTLGTALGDWVADTNDLGYQGGALVFAAGLALIAAAYFFTTISRTLLFWGAFILTRPLGATLGDLLDKPLDDGGLAFSRFYASAILAAVIIACVAFLPQRAGAAPRQATTDQHLANRERNRMQAIHLPTLGARYWTALCLASIFGANMGDLFAGNLGLGHVASLPLLWGRPGDRDCRAELGPVRDQSLHSDRAPGGKAVVAIGEPGADFARRRKLIPTASFLMLRSDFSRNCLAKVGSQLAIMQSEPQIQLAFRPVRRQLGNQFALTNERFKLLQFGLKVGHGSASLIPTDK